MISEVLASLIFQSEETTEFAPEWKKPLAKLNTPSPF